MEKHCILTHVKTLVEATKVLLTHTWMVLGWIGSLHEGFLFEDLSAALEVASSQRQRPRTFKAYVTTRIAKVWRAHEVS